MDDRPAPPVASDAADRDALIARYAARGGRFGRWREALSKHGKLWLWRAVVRGSYALKRLVDLIGAGCALLLLAPLLAFVALAIVIEDGWPVLFVQQRVGLRGRPFAMYKFRSMLKNAEALKDQLAAQNESQAGVIFKMKRDPRITRVGRIIRKLSIDEFPQFWNVLKGDMSLVGPRPPVPKEVAQYTQDERLRLMIKPGLTCYWQIGGRSDIDFQGQVKLDVQYIQSQSLWLDLWIMLKTVPAILLGKGAY